MGIFSSLNFVFKDNRYGKRFQEKVYSGHKFFISPSFKKESEQKPLKLTNCHTLIEMLGKGKIVEEEVEADYVIISSSNKEKYSKTTLTWNQLIDKIPSVTEADFNQSVEGEKKNVRFEDKKGNGKDIKSKKSEQPASQTKQKKGQAKKKTKLT